MAQLRAVPPEEIQFGDLVVGQGLCSRERVDECLSFLGRLLAEGVTPVPRLGELLVRKGYLTGGQLNATLRAGGSRSESSAGPELPEDAAAAAGNPSNVLGKYVKVDRLGAGGMGEVWRGWDRPLRRWVALKFMLHEDARELARFLREAQTAAALNHPHIASIYEVGEINGKPFIAMQYVAGQTLATFPRNEVRRLVELLRDAALAIHYAHEQGVIHRDLKPANLMVESAVGKPRVYVMDFGLAKPTAVDSSLSMSGQVLGTPAYMSPEQARGESSRVGPRSDVYALGATLYELLSDRPPFQETEVYALLRKIVDEDPVPLRRRSPRADRDLETIVLKCLEKDPERRYASARELAEDLTRWLEGGAIQAHPPSAGYQLRKFLLRRRAAVLTGLVVAAVALGILLPNWLSERSRGKRLAELGELRTRMLLLKEWTRQSFRKPEDIRSALEQQLEKVSDFVARNPSLPQGHFVRAQGRVFEGRLEQAEKDLGEAIRLEPSFAPAWALMARVKLEQYLQKKEGNTQDQREANERAARPLMHEAIAALRKGWAERADRVAIERWGLSRTPEDVVAENLTAFIRDWFVERRRESALAHLRAANQAAPSEDYCIWIGICSPSLQEHLAWADRAIEIAPHYAPAYYDRGNANFERKDLDGAIRDFNSVLALDPRSGSALVGRSGAWLLKRDFDRALADAARAIEIDPSDSFAFNNRAAAKLKKRDFGGAIADATEAIRLDPRYPFGYVNRAGARIERGDLEGAIQDAGRAIELDPALALGYSNRAAARLNGGDVEGSLADVTKVLALDSGVPEAYVTRSGVRLMKQDFDGALEDATKALELDPLNAMAYSNRSGARGYKGDLDGAIADGLKAIELAPGLALAHLNLSYARFRKGDLDGALAAATKAIESNGRLALAYINRSTFWLQKEDPDRALADASKAVELAPSLAMAHASRGAARHAKADPQGALADSTRAIELDPLLPEPLVIRAHVHWELKKHAAAIADFQKSLQIAQAGWDLRGQVEEWLKEVRKQKE